MRHTFSVLPFLYLDCGIEELLCNDPTQHPRSLPRGRHDLQDVVSRIILKRPPRFAGRHFSQHSGASPGLSSSCLRIQQTLTFCFAPYLPVFPHCKLRVLYLLCLGMLFYLPCSLPVPGLAFVCSSPVYHVRRFLSCMFIPFNLDFPAPCLCLHVSVVWVTTVCTPSPPLDTGILPPFPSCFPTHHLFPLLDFSTDRGHFAPHLKRFHCTSRVQSRGLTGRRLRLSPRHFEFVTPHRRQPEDLCLCVCICPHIYMRKCVCLTT